jgi:hypothetical protein
MKNLWFEGRCLGWSGGHGGDQYGNCTLYIRTPLFGIIWRYPTGHRQTDVEFQEENALEWMTRYDSREFWMEEYGHVSNIRT